jgi:hypothetical protein
MTNNEVLKKLRIALELKDTDILAILKLSDFEISKGALGDLFRSEDHENFVEAGDQILRNFLNGLIIYKRGPEMKREGSTPKSEKSSRNIMPKILQKEGSSFEKRENKPKFSSDKAKYNTDSKPEKSNEKPIYKKDNDYKNRDNKTVFDRDFFSKKR